MGTVTGEMDKVKGKLESAMGSSESLSESMDRAGRSLTGAAGSSERLSDAIESIRDVPLEDMSNHAEGLAGGLGGGSEQAQKLGEFLGGSDSKLGGMIVKNAKFLGVMGLVAAAAWKVGSAILEWSLEDLNLELERSLSLTQDLARVHEQVTRDMINDADRLASIDEKRASLQESLAVAIRNNTTAQREFRAAQEAAQEGWGNWFKSFADGKWDAEVQASFERAQVRAEATKAAMEELTDAMGELNNKTVDQRSEIGERLKEERILLEDGSEALRQYQLIKDGFSKGEAANIAKQESSLAEAQEEKQTATAIAQAYEAQVSALRVKYLEVEKGAEAAQREIDRQFGMNEQQRENLAAMREKIRLTEEAKAKEQELAEAAKQAEEEAAQAAQKRLDAQRQVRESFEKEVEQLRLKNILLTQGEAAANRERERLQGLTAEQSAILAHLREQNALAEQQQKLEDANHKHVQKRVAGEVKVNEEKKKQSQFGSLTSLAEANQMGVLNSGPAGAGGLQAMNQMQAGAGGAAEANAAKMNAGLNQLVNETRQTNQLLAGGRMKVSMVDNSGPKVDPKQTMFGRRNRG